MQVKIRGQRVEINVAERVIGNALNSTTGYALIATDSHRRFDSTQVESLELILLVEDTVLQLLGLSNVHEVKQLLVERGVAAVYVPNLVIKVGDASLPLTTSGKIERNKLLLFFESIFRADSSVHQSPVASLSDDVDAILSQLAGVLASMSLSCDGYEAKTFLALGGDSLLAIEFLWKIKQKFQVTLTVAEVVTCAMKDLALAIQTAGHNHLGTAEKRVDTVVGKRKIGSVVMSDAATRDVGAASTQVISRALKSFDTSAAAGSGLGVSWKFNMQKCVDSSPLVLITDAKSVVYAGSHSGLIVCLDADSGVILWSNNVHQHIESPLIASADGKVIYVCSYKKNDVDQDMAPVSASEKLGTIHALHASEGNILWETEVEGEIKALPALDDPRGLLYVGCYDHNLYTINRYNGEIRQKRGCYGSIYCSPLLSPCGVYLYVATTKGQVTCLQLLLDGLVELVWSIELLEPIFAAMNIYNTSLIVCTVEGQVHCLDRQTGGLVWNSVVATRPIFSSPCLINHCRVQALTAGTAAADILVVGSHDGFMRILNLINGDVIYLYNVGCVIFAAPIALVTNDKLVILLCTTAGEVLLLDVGSSHVLATIRLHGEIYSSPICCGSCIYLGCRDDHLYAIQLST